MRDLFIEDSAEKAEQPAPSADAAQEIRDSVAGRHVCPFCGAVREQAEGSCPRCTMENTTASRQATKARIGPWYVYQTRNPAAPGMKFETLIGFVRKGRVKPRSIVRGPTTHQLWRFAAHVKGLSREFGVCYSCGGAIQSTTSLCQHCNRPQPPPANVDAFLEGQNEPPKQLKQPEPVMRELELTPLAADDVIVPPLTPRQGRESQRDALDGSTMADERAKKAEGFLSPADLAAAFNLDFRPKSGGNRKANRPVDPPQNRRGFRPRRKYGRWVILLVLILLIGVAAVAIALRPPWRNNAVMTYQQAMNWSKQKWAEFRAPETGHTPARKATDNGFSGSESSGASSAVAPQTQSATTEPSTPTAAIGADKPKSKTWDQMFKSEPENKSTTDANSSYKQGTIDDTRALYRAALEAEQNGDYANAVKKFELIREYPPELRQPDLELQLARARQHLQ